MSFAPFVSIPEFARAAISAAEGAPTIEDFVDFGSTEVRQKSSPYEGQWIGRVGRIPYLDNYRYDYIRFAFGGVDSDAASAEVTIWEWVAGPDGGFAVPVATTELTAEGVLPTIQLERTVGAIYALTVSGLDGGELSFNVAVRGEHAARFGLLNSLPVG